MATSIRETTGRRQNRVSWINGWKDLADANRTPLGIERMPDDGTELLTFRPVPHTARG